MTLATITCDHAEVVWEKPFDTALSLNTVNIWRLSVSSNLRFLPQMEAILQQNELQTASRFHQLKDKQGFILRRGALRILLGRYLSLPPDEIQFIPGENKKPFAKQATAVNLQYNTSHSGDYIAIAIANSPIGVDVELINHDFDYNTVLQHSFSPEEIKYILGTVDPRKRFFNLWTRKEAITKATSKGLDDDLSSVPCVDGIHQVNSLISGSEQDWMVNSFDIHKRHIGSVACYPLQNLRFLDFVF